MHTYSRSRQLGVTLVEIILVFAIIAAGVAGAFMFFKHARVQAAVQNEQRQFDDLVQTINAVYSTKTSFDGISVSQLTSDEFDSTGRFTVRPESADQLSTQLNGGKAYVTVAARTVSSNNDAFDLTYNNVLSDECVRLVPALSSSATSITINNTRVQSSTVAAADAPARGQLASGATIADVCSESSSAKVVFTIYSPRNTTALSKTPLTPALCSPVTERESAACPTGQIGTITKERTGTCTGTDNSMVYSDWTTVDNTCETADPSATPTTATAAADDCTTIAQTRVDACSSGYTGGITLSRTENTCTGAYTAWAQISNTCTAIPSATATCTPYVATRTQSCPAGQGGAISQEQSYTCATSTAAPVGQGWVTTGSTCTASCLASGNCCRIQSDQQTTSEKCSVGYYGNPVQSQIRYSTCPTATSTTGATWGSWETVDTSGTTCTACPSNATETQTQWVSASAACSSGQTGTHVGERTATNAGQVLRVPGGHHLFASCQLHQLVSVGGHGHHAQ